MNHIDLIVFDLGGTTTEDHGEVPKAFRAALNSHGIDVTEEELLTYRGRSKIEVIRSLINIEFGIDSPESDDQFKHVYGEFCDELERQFRDHGVTMISGALQTFAWLRQHNVKIAITTGFDRKIADIILKQLSWDKNVLGAIVCSDDVPQGRPAPYMIFRTMEATHTTDVRRVMKVGDTPVDIQAGTNAGVHTIGVLSGPHDAESLKKANPNHIIPNIARLPDLLEHEGYL